MGKESKKPGKDEGDTDSYHRKDTDQTQRQDAEQGGRRVPNRGGADEQSDKGRSGRSEPEPEEELNFDE